MNNLPNDLYAAFRMSAKKNAGRTAYIYNEKKISYAELLARVDQLADKLTGMGVHKGTRVGIISRNRPEWAMADLAILKLGGVVVPIHYTLPVERINSLIEYCWLEYIFAENTGHLAKKIITLDMNNLFQGEQVNRPLSTPPIIKPDDLATIAFASGLTDDLKGVMLSHNNIISNTFAAMNRYCVVPGDVSVSYLPFSHMFARTTEYYAGLFSGGCLVFFTDAPKKLLAVVEKVKPTAMLSVPYVIEKIYTQAVANITNGPRWRKYLVFTAVKTLNQHANIKYKNIKIPVFLRIKKIFYELLIAKKIRSITGGKLRFIVCGGAPLDKQIAKTLTILGLPLVQGYGLTEASPVVSSCSLSDNRVGTVGKAFDDVKIRIASDDEILVQGPGIMKGYLNNPKATQLAIDPDGWLHTGDKGRIDAYGNLVVIGRAKELIITSAGQNIVPEYLEKLLQRSLFIEQAMVFGDRQKHIYALVYPNHNAIRHYANQHTNATQQTKDFVRIEIEKISSRLPPHEQIKKFALLETGFTIENGLLTPTLKLKRDAIQKKYKVLIDSFYL